MNNQERPQLRISPKQIADSLTVTCPCGNKLFEEGIVFKKLSPLISPSGKEEYFPIQVIVCKKCGKVPDIFDTENIVPEELKTKVSTITTFNPNTVINTK